MAILLILLWRLDYGCYWDDLPETIVIGINQRNNRMEDCRYNKDNGFLPKRRAFFEFIGGELPYIEKKNTIPHRLELLPDMIQQQVLNFFIRIAPFNAYISLSPELAPEMETRIPKTCKIKSCFLLSIIC
jgi:hypothetical protein